MRIVNDADLTALNTFRVRVRAQTLARLDHWYEIEELIDRGTCPAPWLVVGGGSNILFRNDFPGTIILVESRGISLVDSDGPNRLVRVAAGENWDRLVRWAAQRNLWGIENLALIPGTTGAAPIQNIGAYGAELASVIESVKAFDLHRGEWVEMDRAECRFGYRDSTFKEQPDRYLITEVRLLLCAKGEALVEYAGVREALADNTNPSALDMANVISELRRQKLPDPMIEPNAGSFFKNPMLTRKRHQSLLEQHPKMPGFVQDDLIKVSAGWLIESCGLKGQSLGGALVSPRHALVLINNSGATGQEIWQLARRCQDAVYNKFGIILEPEPVVV